ncbi:MAG: HIT domain-containing protein [Proteobacteria bacterium]|nr:MAG: HIT domain-containing protein [Pseudomonadota bacterium]
MADDCIFCKIVAGAIPAPKVLESEDAIVIRDISPQAAKHFLVLPKNHVDSLANAFDQGVGETTVAALFKLANQLVRQEGLLPNGFRSVINSGAGLYKKIIPHPTEKPLRNV